MEIYYHVLTRLLKNRWLVLAVCAAISFWVKMVHEGPEYLWGVEVAGRYLIYYALGDVFSLTSGAPGRAGPSGWPQRACLPWWQRSAFIFCMSISISASPISPSLAGMEEAPYWMLSLLTFLYQCSAVVCAMVLGFAFQQVPLLAPWGA